ncbi:trypsin-like cysteine/serine peptidase domain-containing protein [Cunninghamella echinulata]|nr:trypsin-like cysteine/serine peptidase domain-containing protein [Cunninghamella echinulata]
MQNATNIHDDSLYPFFAVVNILSINENNQKNPIICGGSIINLNPPKIITAAHCLQGGVDPSRYIHSKKKIPHYVSYGHTNRNQQTKNNIIDWVMHPNYTISGEPKYDVAILTLENPILRNRFVDRVPIWVSDRYKQFQGALVGYGYQEVNGQSSTILQRLTFDVNNYNFKSDNMVEAVATFEVDKRTACHGDSGGPLIVQFPYDTSSSSYPQHHPLLKYYIIGPLTRIFNVKDPDPSHLTCPIRLNAQNNIVQSFAHLAPMLDWVAPLANMSKEELITPDYQFDSNVMDAIGLLIIYVCLLFFFFWKKK